MFALAELHSQRSELVVQANALWVDGKRERAKKLARRVVAIESEIEALVSSAQSRQLEPPA